MKFSLPNSRFWAGTKIFLALNAFFVIPLYLAFMWNMHGIVSVNLKTEQPLTLTMSDPGIPEVKRVGGCAVGLEGVPAFSTTLAQPYRIDHLDFAFTGGSGAIRFDELSYVRCRILKRFMTAEDFAQCYEADEGTRIERRADGVYIVLTGATGGVHSKPESFTWSGAGLTFADFSTKARVAFCVLQGLILLFSIGVTFLKRKGLTCSVALGQVCLAALIAAFLTLAMPFQTALQSSGELGISVSSLWGAFAIAFLLLTLDLALLFILTYSRCGNFFPMVGVLVIVYEYFQTGILSAGIPPLDGSLLFFENTALMWRDAGVTAILAAMLLGGYKWTCPYRYWIAIATLIMGLAGLLDVKTVAREEHETATALASEWNRSVDEMVESVRWSTNRNVIVLIPDTVQSDVSLDVVQKNLEIKAYFPGFTGFSNNVGTHRFTIPSIPAMMTGHYDDGMESEDHSVERLTKEGCGFWPYYTNNVPMSIMALIRYTNRLSSDTRSKPVGNTPRAKVSPLLQRQPGIPYFNLNNIIAFRLSPFWLKCQMIELCSMGIGEGSRNRDEGAFYPRLTLASVDESISNNLVVMHTMGNHLPLRYDRHGGTHDRLPQNYDTMFEQTYYVLDQIGRFLNVLKAKGIYDKSIIIIAADHGSDAAESRIMGGDKVIGRVVPMLWVKPIGSKGEFTPSFIPTAQINLHKVIEASYDRDLSLDEVLPMLREEGNRLWRYSMHGETDELLIDANGHVVSKKHYKQY